MPIRLILADDHPLILDGLLGLLGREPDFTVVATSHTGVEALAAVATHRPDLLVLDLRMPELGGLDVLRTLGEEPNPPRVVLLTAAMDEDEVLEAINLGAQGVVLKEAASEVLVQCLRQVHAGSEWIDEDLARRARARASQRRVSLREVASALTPREIEVVRLLSRGLRNRDIAERTGITEGTVKVHLHNIYEKLGLGGRMALMLWAQAKGLDAVRN